MAARGVALPLVSGGFSAVAAYYLTVALGSPTAMLSRSMALNRGSVVVVGALPSGVSEVDP